MGGDRSLKLFARDTLSAVVKLRVLVPIGKSNILQSGDRSLNFIPKSTGKEVNRQLRPGKTSLGAISVCTLG
jgi:hypothetical protein